MVLNSCNIYLIFAVTAGTTGTLTVTLASLSLSIATNWYVAVAKVPLWGPDLQSRFHSYRVPSWFRRRGTGLDNHTRFYC